MTRRSRVWAVIAVVASLLCVAQPASAASADVVRVTRLFGWPKPSPDPTGLTYDRRTHRILISDAEVEETTVWEGRNFFLATRKGHLLAARKLTRFTREPEDLAWNAGKRTLYAVDDDAAVVFRIRAGRDHVLGTNDDTGGAMLHTDRFGANDPEGLAWWGEGKMLIVTDASNDRVYKVRRGRDRRWDTRDDRVRSFGTLRFGFTETEDVWYDVPTGHLLIVSSRVPGGQDFIAETTIKGDLIQKIFLPVEMKASGIIIAPGTDGTPRHLYVTDSGRPEDVAPNENDGRLYELEIVP